MPIRLGTDIVEIERLERLIEAGGAGFLERWFTAGERAYCAGKAHPAAHYAARLAAKEAVAKALRWQWTEPVPWRDIEIVHDEQGAPLVRLTGRVEALARAHSIADVAVSLSHAQQHATAVAFAFASADRPSEPGAKLHTALLSPDCSPPVASPPSA